jgi:hypothetical protein
MVVVDLAEEIKANSIRGKLGRPNGLGEIWCGWSHLGDEDILAGYYQRRPRPTGQIFVRMKHYVPTPIYHENQQTWRGVFANGVVAWKALNAEQKLVWNRTKYPRHMSGFCRFMRNFLKSQ